eukprot:gene13474-biopygen11826
MTGFNLSRQPTRSSAAESGTSQADRIAASFAIFSAL